MERILPIPAVIASLAPASLDDARRLVRLVPPAANGIEWRLDLAPGGISPRALLELDPRVAIVTWRTVREGGRFSGTREEYRRHVLSAYEAGAVVDVELESGVLADRDFLPDRRRVIGSFHGASLSEARVRAALAHDVAALKLVLTDPGTVADALACLDLLRLPAREKPLACFATGIRGAATRVLAPRFGSALAYGSVDGDPTGTGQIPLAELAGVYGAAGAPPEKIFAVYGEDVGGSLSPSIHNALFRHRRLPWLYVPLSASRRESESASPIAADLVALDGVGRNLSGISVTNPFKHDFGGVAVPDGETERIGAANTLVRRRPECLDLTAHNTDVRAVREALGRLGGGRVVVLGTGGAARAALAAAAALGRETGVAGRSPAKAEALASRFGASVVDAERALPDVWVNATTLGSAADDPLPLPARSLGPGSAVVDFVYYRRGDTPLVREARARGARVVDGRELLARQAAGQAELFGVADATFEEIDAVLRDAPVGGGA